MKIFNAKFEYQLGPVYGIVKTSYREKDNILF